VKAQTKWRITGGAAISVAGLLAIFGADTYRQNGSPWFFVAWWGLFLVMLGVALFCAWLDLRYIRLQYKLGQRAIFEETIGSEDFRRELRERSRR
jgi:drug/metabolite transporter (DMT)-like permease